MSTVDPVLYDLIKQFEGCQLKAYKCPAGVWTCGWGSTGADVNERTVWTQEQADNRMHYDAQRFVEGVAKFSPILTQHPKRWAAIADFAYNLGLDAYKSSTLRKRVDAGNWTLAVSEIKRWNRAGNKVLLGLIKRREAEAALLV